MRYQSEEYEHASKSFKHSHYADESVIIAALRIATAVTTKGIIDRVIFELGHDMDDMTCEQIAKAIREVLIGDPT